MITAIIIDDEQHCINKLSYLLAQHYKSSIQLLSSFQTVEEGVAAIQHLQPDLLFLDVEFHDKTGFDVLRHFDEIPFAVIFTTAHEEYAIQAIKFSAVDYLLKPINADELKAAIEKLKREHFKNDITKRIKSLLENLAYKDAASKRISLPTKSGYKFVSVNDIIRCVGNSNYTDLFLKNNQKINVAKTLKDFEELLTDYGFYRVHQSDLINLAYIKSYSRDGSVCMMDDSKIQVSTRRKEDFLQKLKMM